MISADFKNMVFFITGAAVAWIVFNELEKHGYSPTAPILRLFGIE